MRIQGTEQREVPCPGCDLPGSSRPRDTAGRRSIDCEGLESASVRVEPSFIRARPATVAEGATPSRSHGACVGSVVAIFEGDDLRGASAEGGREGTGFLADGEVRAGREGDGNVEGADGGRDGCGAVDMTGYGSPRGAGWRSGGAEGGAADPPPLDDAPARVAGRGRGRRARHPHISRGSPRSSLRFGRAARSISNCVVSLDAVNRDSPSHLQRTVAGPAPVAVQPALQSVAAQASSSFA